MRTQQTKLSALREALWPLLERLDEDELRILVTHACRLVATRGHRAPKARQAKVLLFQRRA